MAEENRQAAREIVEDIMRSHGGITATDRAATPAQVLRSLDGVRESLAKATTVLSNQLYSKDTRFVYELIQNAEDNTYNFAKANGLCPSLIFTVAPGKIIVDSNEDGFTEANVRAICQLGGSTKTVSRGFIGEKGIGFKSVFKVASRVKVQSGNFCFAFEHGDEDHGLGMVTPINDDHESLPKNVRTRFTLTLNEHSSFEDRVTELKDLPDTLLLYLTKLKRISIHISKDVRVSETVYEFSYDENLRLGTLCKSELLGIVSSQTSRLYYMERRRFKDLPSDKARPYTNEAEVVLAFPVDKYRNPVIEQQHVFAYLPMRKVGFNFQIQSDFITQASREDLFDSAWNRALLVNIASTFRQAVLRFRNGHSLEFTWMRYLPSRNVSEQFWANLRDIILRFLKGENVLQSWAGNSLRRGEELRRVPLDCLDANGEPLFARPLFGPYYLSTEYSIDDMELLAALGVQTLSDGEFCDAVSLDLGNSTSRLKSDATNDDWHTRTARKLLAIAKSDFPRVRDLKCIPLQNGSWASSSEGAIYFPEYRAVSVPSDLDLRLVRKEALKNTTRKELFSKLGVKTCSPEIATPRILRRYNTSGVELQSSVSHLRWLYHFLPKNERGLDRRIPLFASDGVPTYRVFVTLGRDLRVSDLYFKTKGDFGVKELCRERWSMVPTGRIIHHDVYFINKAYLNAVAPTISVNGTSWLEWLEESAAVRRFPRLVNPVDPSKLSNLFSWLVSHRPEQVVGTLHAHWPSYKDQMKPEIVSILRGAKVLRKGIEGTSLEATWMPTQELLELCKDFDLVDKMPFLELPVELDSKNEEDWKFLVQFGVGFETNTALFLGILRVLRDNSDVYPESVPRHLLKAYEAIEKNCNSSRYDEISEFFADGEYILVPPSASKTGKWTGQKHCLWKAPAFIDYRNVLGSLDEYRDNRSIKYLFTGILSIPDINCKHYVEQLEVWKDKKRAVKNIAGVYRHVFRSVAGRDGPTELCQSFESKKLIYVPSQKNWYPPSSCMWAKSTRIAGKVAIASEFPQLEDFFIGTLKVEQPNKSTYITELLILCRAGSAPSIPLVKASLWEINSWEPSESDLDVLKPLNVLPVKDSTGKLCLRNIKDTFVLFDRQSHADTFKGKVAYLDFDMEDLRLLRPIINSLGLDTRYTSRLVNEESRAQHVIPEPSLSKDLQLRAYAIFRCAVYYQDCSAMRNRDSLYQRFRQADVHLSDNISTTITLALNGMIIASESTRGTLHLQDDGSHIHLYVPCDVRLRELSYLTQVPERIVSHFGIKDRGAAKVFGDVLKSSLAVLDDVLTNHGIVRVPGVTPEPMPRDETPTLSVSSARQSLRAEPGTSAPSSASTVIEEITSSVTSVTEVSSVRAQSTSLARDTGSSSGRAFAQEESSKTRGNPSNEKYRALLDHVIKSVQSERGHVSRSDKAFVPDEVFGDRAANPILHDMKIGAAGELFAFEFLLVFLSSFSFANWRSKIRKFVCVHENYSHMPVYDGPETADIVYEDANGRLTEFLIRHQYLDEEIWTSQTPKYFLEVKTTTQVCETRFFMSKAQVQRMERMLIPPGEAAAEVYVIMRVSNLGQKDIDLDFFVDPETLRRNGQLRFESESYTVFPSK